jgi:hypothetical protein
MNKKQVKRGKILEFLKKHGICAEGNSYRCDICKITRSSPKLSNMQEHVSTALHMQNE